MAEPIKLTEDEVMSLLKCGRCGAPAYSHTDLSRAAIGSEACELNVMESHASAVEIIIASRVEAALDAVEADLRAKPWTPQWGRDDWMEWLRRRRGTPRTVSILDDVDGDLAEQEEIVMARHLWKEDHP
jgi:hypothetical protein